MQTNNTHAASTVHVVQGSPPTGGSSPPVDTGCQNPKCRESFKNWELADDESLDFETMATAGWYYIGDGRVKSCCCGIDREWKVTDDPWTQHALHGPECSFLKQQKGQAYIDRVRAAISTNEGREPELEQSDIQMSPQDEEFSKLVEENERLRKQENCWVCGDEPRQIMYIPCGELACCKDCDPAQLKCPICKGTIKGKIVTFWS
ncbi:putative inhibitor of apoptosis [Mizuhopecten yessoensis]|uniref:putative inhibitor of apoptosis n=1 Tax=Mizuhopecten yessoensis TaxID=6573 RepID=UPI000B45C52B|nr:putative inhibitor of apoptosis [Mizuhopecten yessoensis]